MGEPLIFGVPCYVLAHRETDDTFEMVQSIAAWNFGNMGRCVLLFRERQMADEAGRALGYEIIVEIDAPFLELVLDAEKGKGSKYVAIDLVRTTDSQTAVQFRSIDEIVAHLRREITGC
jgi:hypothetical protein